MPIRFDGQTVLVTGAGRGLGRATALEFARRGANVALCARSADQVAEVARVAEALGARALGVALDVADWHAVEALARQTLERFGAIDVVVNNAGVIEPVAPLWRADPWQWLRNVEINLSGAFLVLRAVLPGMVERRRGVVINVTTGAANPRVRVQGWTAYAAAKAGLDQLTRVLARELEPFDVRALAFAPGLVDTPMQEHIRSLSAEEFGAENLVRFRRYHTEGLLLPPEKPARAIVWLASPAAADIGGDVVDISDPRVEAGIAALAR